MIIVGTSIGIFILLGSVSLSFADILNPKQQLAEGIAPEYVQCRESQVLFFYVIMASQFVLNQILSKNL